MVKKKLSQKRSAKAMRRLRAQLKDDLLEIIGRECEECGSKHDIQPHHTQTREWASRDVWTTGANGRLRLYIRDALDGKVIALCGTCNRSAGKPVDNEPF